MTRPVPMDLQAHARLLDGAREFLRLWAGADGRIACFVKPGALGPDPALLGAALADAMRHGAATYARMLGIGEAEASARIREGLDAGLAEAAPARPAGGPITYDAPKEGC